MFGPVRLFRWFTEPTNKMADPELRRRSRFFLSMLAVLWVIWILMVLSLPLRITLAHGEGSRHYLSTQLPIVFLAIGVTGSVVSALARRGFYSTAARLFGAAPAVIAFGWIFVTGDLQLIAVPVVAIALCSVLLSSLDTIVAFVVIMVGYLIVPGMIAGVSTWDVSGAMILTTVIGSVSLAATVFRTRDRRQIVAQAVELTQNNERLGDAKKMEAIARLSSGIANEFSRIVAAVDADAQIIERTGGGAALERAKSIRHATERAGRLTDRLLSFSEQQTLQVTSVDIDEVMRTHEHILNSLAREDTTILLRPSPESKILKVDVELFCLAIQTLVRKAQENIHGGGTITIETRIADLPHGDGVSLPAGAYCAVIIRNSGSVDTAGDGTRIFEPFFTTGEFGTGDLDLAAAYGIVRQSGGSVEMRIDPELGATFEVTVPRVESSV